MNISKIGLVIGHEYAVRVRKKSFILTTLLTPVLFGALICVPALIMLWGGGGEQKVKIIDGTGEIAARFEDSGNARYELAAEGETLDLMKELFKEMDLYAIVDISDFNEKDEVSVTTYSKEPLNMEIKSAVSSTVNKAVEDRKLTRYNINNLEEIMADVKTDIRLNTLTLKEDGKAEEDSVEIYMILSYVMSFLIYMFVFMFGTMVMRSVIDEKSSRVVEVVVSSVNSVDLMIGKIVGVALVALTQFAIWIGLTAAIAGGVMGAAGPKLMGSLGNTEQLMQMAADPSVGVHPDNLDLLTQAAADDNAPQALKMVAQIRNLNWGYIVGCFLLYFLLGYLLYAAMFAAVGSAVDNEADTQQLQLPLTLPLIIGLFIMLHTFEHPGSQLSIWASIIPWTSPMVMLARIPFGIVPAWQLILSLVLLALTFLGTAWVSAKIYKAGILMYGKKSSFKDLWHWIRMKE
ncbi:MAG: ABC transporter permease [Bacteroidales bacterium]|nr:ABC transporter permease [Bacteroidales bacterium]